MSNGVEIALIEPKIARARCLPAASERAVASDGTAKLFVRLVKGINSTFSLLFRACLPGRDAPRYSDDVAETTPWSENGTRAEKFVFSRAYLAWEQADYDKYGEGGVYMRMVDMATAQMSSQFVGFEKERETVSEVALSGSGRLAWIRNVELTTTNGQSSQAGNVETIFAGEMALGRVTHPTLLEATNNAVLSGLRFTGDGSLHWLDAGVERTAMF